MQDINTERLRQAVDKFVYSSGPSNPDSSANCTNADIKRLIDGIKEMMNEFVDELNN